MKNISKADRRDDDVSKAAILVEALMNQAGMAKRLAFTLASEIYSVSKVDIRAYSTRRNFISQRAKIFAHQQETEMKAEKRQSSVRGANSEMEPMLQLVPSACNKEGTRIMTGRLSSWELRILRLVKVGRNGVRKVICPMASEFNGSSTDPACKVVIECGLAPKNAEDRILASELARALHRNKAFTRPPRNKEPLHALVLQVGSVLLDTARTIEFINTTSGLTAKRAHNLSTAFVWVCFVTYNAEGYWGDLDGIAMERAKQLIPTIPECKTMKKATALALVATALKADFMAARMIEMAEMKSDMLPHVKRLTLEYVYRKSELRKKRLMSSALSVAQNASVSLHDIPFA